MSTVVTTNEIKRSPYARFADPLRDTPSPCDFAAVDKCRELAIYLTQVTPIYSVQARGRLSAGSGRIRTAVHDRRGVSPVPGPAALARRISVPALWAPEGVARTGGPPLALRRLWPSD